MTANALRNADQNISSLTFLFQDAQDALRPRSQKTKFSQMRSSDYATRNEGNRWGNRGQLNTFCAGPLFRLAVQYFESSWFVFRSRNGESILFSLLEFNWNSDLCRYSGYRIRGSIQVGTSRQVPISTQPLNQWMPRDFSEGVKRPRLEVDQSLHLLSRLWMPEPYIYLSHISLWCAA